MTSLATDRTQDGLARPPHRRWLAALTRRAYPASLLFGAITALALPPFPFVFLPCLLGFAGWLHLLIDASSRRAAFLLGWWFGLGYFVVGLYWIAIAFFTDVEKFGALAIPAVLLLCATLAVFPALAGLAFRLTGLRHPAAAAIALALLWIGAEWLRAQFLWGFPWNLIGYAWINALPISQLAAWTGIYGLSLIAVLSGALFATTLGLEGKARWSGPAAAGLMIAAIFALGSWRLAGEDPGVQANVRLRLVQGNIPQAYKWDPDLRAASFRRYLDLSASRPAVSSDAAVTHIIWPESASPYLLDRDEAARRLIGQVTPAGGALITGANRFDLTSEPRRAWNSLVALDDQGAILASYDKRRLVPFGEFLPWRRVLSRIGLKKITDGTIDFQPGSGERTLDLEGLPPFSPLICYEVIFSGDVASPDHRPDWLLNITNDAWFGRSSGPYQHFAMARMRAIEEGLPLVRSANTGISAVVDAFGRVRGELGLGQTGVLDAALPAPLAKPTFFAEKGAVLFLLMVAFGFGIIFLIEKNLRN